MAKISAIIASVLTCGCVFDLTEANSMYIARKCRGHACTNTHYPILDYHREEGQCHCRQHPCWNDQGNLHSCPTMDFPYLTFSYNRRGALSCACGPSPFYSSAHIAKDLCPGFRCDAATHSSLDYDEEADMCFCRANPCWDIGGMKHGCGDPNSPILRYSEELLDGHVKPTCECIPRMEQPKLPNVEM